MEIPELRIVPDDLWRAVQDRATKQSAARGNRRGPKPKHLLSGLLKCDCGANYIIEKGQGGRKYYGCAAHYDRGPDICDNSSLIRLERVEKAVLDAIFNEVCSPETIEYLHRKVNDAIAEMSAPASEIRKKRRAELAEWRRRLGNIKAAIADGIRTPSTLQMLEEAETRVSELEAALAAPQNGRVVALREIVIIYLAALKASLKTDMDAARALVARLVGPIAVKKVDGHLVAEVRGNLLGILESSVGVFVVPEEGLEPPRA